MRYHGSAPHINQLGMLKAIAIKQTESCAAAITFARDEGLAPPAEPTHAPDATIRVTLACEKSGDSKEIVTTPENGPRDLQAYDAHVGLRMFDSGFSDQELASAPAVLPLLAG